MIRSVRWMRLPALVGVLFLLAAGQPADPLSPPANRVGRADPRYLAFTGVTLHAKPDATVENATVVIRLGLIEAVGPGATPPDGAKVIDARGLHLYPGFIDPFVEVDATRPDLNAKGAHWNASVTPQRSALDGKGIDDGVAESLRKMGFTAAGIAPKGGIVRGSGACVSLAKPDADAAVTRPPVYKDRVFHALGFTQDRAVDAGEARWSGYPGSQMGAIALLRQTFSDASFRAAQVAANKQAGASCLDALNASAPLFVEVEDELETLRAWKIADEFSRPSVIVTNGTEFRRLAPVAAHKSPLIVTLNYPEKPRVATIAEAEGGGGPDLRELLTWEQAPTNARRLKQAGVEFALSTAKLKDKSFFRERLRTAIRHGLSERDALAAITTAPASILGVADRMGTAEVGRVANLVLCDGNIFDKKTKVLDVYIDGTRHAINPPSSKLEGVYSVELDPVPPGDAKRFVTIDAEGGITVRRAAKEEKKDAPAKDDKQPDADKKPVDAKPPEGEKKADAPAAAPPAKDEWKEKSVKAKNVTVADDRVSFTFEHDALGGPTGVFTHSGLVESRDAQGRATLIRGDGTRADGSAYRFAMTRLPASDWQGAGGWRVTEFEGKPKPADAKDQLKLEFTHTHEGLQLKLTFTKEKGDPIVIECDNEKLEGNTLTFSHSLKKLGGEGESRDTLTLNAGGGAGDALVGEGTLPDGSKHPYAAARWKDDDEPKVDVPEKLPGLPFGAYALETLPKVEKTLILYNATVWTSGPEGVIENAGVLIRNGKIEAVGKQVVAPTAVADSNDVRAIDCKGMHITPGIIDCHSHTGISKGVNEGGQAVTAEVRIGDVTNPDAMGWYRQLAGGVTAVNNLHGSANPIGGQNQVNKLRWGCAHPDDMHLAGAIPGIKFALGENVKWGNRDDTSAGRYPQTRMGVETLIRDRFLAAREYADSQTRDAKNTRRDLELECLSEILAGKRLIHCHSYRQDEILMLARVAQEFNFKLGTYQHILEGYKVADLVRDTSIGASAFADWWAYKVEVQDAIPQGGPIMAEQGVIVSFNSDSDEMARRMNVEAAKAHKYSRLPDGTFTISEAEALKFVTINPAKQLKIDATTGSLEAGKDADVVIWNGPPLSALSRAERTFIDGREMWSRDADAKLRERDAKERRRIVQKILADKGDKKPDAAAASPGSGGGSGGRRRPPQTLLERMWQDRDDFISGRYLEAIRRGRGREDVSGGAGTCGCDEK